MGVLNNGIAVDAEEFKFQNGSIGVRISWKDLQDNDSKVQHIDVNISRSEDKVEEPKTELEQAWEKWKEKYCQNTKKQSADEKTEEKEQKTSFVEMDPVQWARIRVLDERGFYGVDFSHHKTLNWFFRDCLWCESTVMNCHADQFIRGMERSLKCWKRAGYVTLSTVLYYIGATQKFTSEELKYFLTFEWNKEHPFDYQLTVTRPDEEHGIEYYAVFSSAPVQRK